jgi:hypothetical protein
MKKIILSVRTALLRMAALGVCCAVAVAVAGAVGIASPADASGEIASSHWLMLVGTKNMNPSDEDGFNRWYDDIDIPDVLMVPGYRRARRGVRQTVAALSPKTQESEDGRYLALYDIETGDIDRTIIDMLMAAKKMDMSGRSIEALKVTERVYFHQRAALEVSGARPVGKGTFWYLERVACCRDDASVAALNDWYDYTRIPELTQAGIAGLMRVARFEVHRVVMVEPRQVPRFLTLYEFSADSAEQVVAAMRDANERLVKAGKASELFVETGSSVFKEIRDIRR